MLLRWLKILLVFSMGLMCLFYALQNLVNLDSAYAVVSTVTRMENHSYYPSTFGFALTSEPLIWLATAFIVCFELLAGIVFVFAAWHLLKKRKAPQKEFQSAKYLTHVGTAIALLIWFGLFQTLGGAFFQMWQTELGDASFDGSFAYLASIALVTLFVNLVEPTN
ncbi:hypothetical protein PSI9734_00894 [Pseudidiomarina piscicola]|uniref:Small integral membrane protein n=1 Tax=Pseudidiomarina piscicola TaxID=2614830 RepID=A0A6S6WIV1_9GAMM|nr:DUF2165 family protein [Pseudidiomarina piscicola]CAB0150343.1 hypothetical protein PSI9734_00894 [Pseudidiomarina piscicola]VZT39771.1 hypothetical protein PSI9734_00894 [Pseudomonas aeruginosa]